MASVYKQVTLNLSADKLWEMVADVANLSNLLDGVQHSEVDGTTRSCTFADGAKLRETILGVDHENKRVAYTILEAPFKLDFHAGSMQVRDAGDGKSTLVWAVDVLPEAMADPINGLLDGEMGKLKERF